jgi:hypothetical protein
MMLDEERSPGGSFSSGVLVSWIGYPTYGSPIDDATCRPVCSLVNTGCLTVPRGAIARIAAGGESTTAICGISVRQLLLPLGFDIVPIARCEKMNCSAQNLGPDTIAEIERHKYFLSEKAGYDVGWEFAEQDWLSNHAGPSDEASDPQSEAPTAKGLGSMLRRWLAKAGVL